MYGFGKAMNRAYGLIESQSSIDERNLQKAAQLRTAQLQDQQLEQQAQKDMAAYEEQISKFTDDLLIYDKQKINRKAKLLARGLKENLDGSSTQYSSFISQGGHRLMQDYKSNVINSEEAAMFKENKENAERIIKAQMNKMGHLINSRDLQSLKDYQRNKGGKITFTGMLSEVEMPDLMSYAFGEEVPASDILENNYMAIRGNYILENPDNPNPTKSELLTYTNLRYGAKGKNVNAKKEDERFKQLKQLFESQLKANKDSRTNTGTRTTTTGSGQEQYGINGAGFTAKKSTEVLSLIDKAANTIVEDFTTDFWNTKFQHPELIRLVSNGSWDTKFRRFNPTEKGIRDITLDSNYYLNFMHEFVPKNALRVYQGVDMQVAQVALNIPADQVSEDMDFKNGIIHNYMPGSDLYMADGSSLKDIELHNKNRGDYKVEGTIIAAVASNKNGSAIIMDAYDGNELVTDEDGENDDRLYTGTDKIKPQMFTVLRDVKTDNVYYAPIDLSNEVLHKQFDQTLGELNDVTSVRQSNYDLQKDEDMLEAQKKKEVQKLMNKRKEFRSNPSAYSSMLVEINNHMTTDGYNDDRAKLIEAFYLINADLNSAPGELVSVMSSMTEDAFFTNGFLATLKMETGIDFEKLLKDPNITNEEIIQKMLDADPNNNEQFYILLSQLYKTLKEN